jgi:Na+/H+-dicarboxylate symporter
VKFLGDLFLNALKMIVLPLIITSMVTGIASLGDIRKAGRTGVFTLVYYFATTALAVILGLILVNLFQPGAHTVSGVPAVQQLPQVRTFSFTDFLLTLIPPNLFESLAQMQILPVIIFSLLLGGSLSTLGEKGEPVVKFFAILNEAIIQIVKLVMWFAPVGIFGLIAGKFASIGGGEAFYSELTRLGNYTLTVLSGIFLHGLVTLPLILLLLGRRSPAAYGYNMSTTVLTALSTSSSAATLPVTIEAVEKRNKVPNSVAGFVLPLGATINMDGTALYEAVTAIFIAQIYAVKLTLGQQMLIFLTASVAAIGAAPIPQAGLVTMVMVLQAVNLPVEGIATILAVDWFVDRFRTVVNVWGDAVGAAVVQRMAGVEK